MPEGKKEWRKIDERLIKLGMNMVEAISGILVMNKEVMERELEEMNRGKRGARYKCPKSIIIFLEAHNTMLPYRQLSGLVKALFKFDYHYTSIEKRVKKEKLMWRYKEIKGGLIFYKRDIPVGKYFIESSGFGIRRKGVWRVTKFKIKVKKKWYKLHKICNKKGEIVAFAVTEEYVSDSVMFRKLARYIPPNSVIYGDKAYFSRKNYKFAKKRGLILHSPPKKNAVGRAKGVPYYSHEVRLYSKLGYDKWKNITGYKERFNKEFVFSRLKMLFGENLRAHSLKGAAISLLNMISLCNSVL